MRIALFFILGVALLQAETINQLIDRSLKNHRSLKAIELRISASDEYIAKSRNFDNPNLSLTVNDIQFDDISNRSLEAMQWTAIRVKQKFPWFGKRDAKTEKRRSGRGIKLRNYPFINVPHLEVETSVQGSEK
ncbi:MAG: TolC family protein [Campylobacterota bacterium]|nr:TolC family protein [Campylobacterota bacterium]